MFEFIQNIDFLILDFIQKYLTSPFMDKLMLFASLIGNAGAVWIVAGVVFLCIKKYRKIGVMMVVSLVIGLVLGNFILKPGLARLRPFLIKEEIELIIAPPGGYSFPSGHTLSSVISAVVIFMNNKKIGIYAIILAVLIAFSRLYLYVHFPSDVIGGTVLGILIGYATFKIFNKQKNTI